jgi:hypothetical protein
MLEEPLFFGVVITPLQWSQIHTAEVSGGARLIYSSPWFQMPDRSDPRLELAL